MLLHLGVKDPSDIVTPKNLSFIVMGTPKFIPMLFMGGGGGGGGEGEMERERRGGEEGVQGGGEGVQGGEHYSSGKGEAG